MRRLVLVFLVMFMGCGNTLVLDPQTTVRITGVVSSRIMGASRELLDMSKSSDKLTLLINSPGGSVLAGLQFIDTMELLKSRGVTLRCVVPNLAASMAFIILAHCDERYTLPSAILLFHPAKVGCFMCSMSAEELLYAGSRLQEMESYQDNDLINRLNVSKDFYFYHKVKETIWLAYVFQSKIPGFITVVSDVQGIDNFQSMDSEVEGFLDNLFERAEKDF